LGSIVHQNNFLQVPGTFCEVPNPEQNKEKRPGEPGRFVSRQAGGGPYDPFAPSST